MASLLSSKIKAEPIRMCVACRQRAPKRELLRFVRVSSGEVVFDREGSFFGRSAYLCHSPSCAEQARRKRLVERHLGSKVGEDLWEGLQPL